MALPWLRILDLVLTVTDVARKANRRSVAALLGEPDSRSMTTQGGGGSEAKLATVVVAALKEAFNRDHQRLEFEREQREAERRRAERLLKMELARQTGDREIGRLRLLAGMAIVSLLASLLIALAGGLAGPGARVALGAAWLCLLAALATSFSGQSAVAAGLAGIDEKHGDPPAPSSGAAGIAALWLVLAGLAVMAVAVLVR